MSAISTAHRIAGGLSLVAGTLAVLGGIGPLLKVRSASALGELFGDAPARAPGVPAAHWAVFAGALLIVAGAGLLFAGRAERVRAAVSVLWVAPIPSALAALRTASAAVDAAENPDPFVQLAAPALAFDWGSWLLVAAMACAGATGFACLVAGVFDREAWEAARELAEDARAEKGNRKKGKKARRVAEVEADPREAPLDRRTFALYAAAGGFGALGPLLPLYVGPGFCSSWLPDVPFSSQAFGQFLLATVIAAAAFVGARSRPSRQPALCAGAALSLVAYVAGYPFLSGASLGSTPGPGFWASLVGAVAFAVAAGAVSRLSGRSLGSLRRDRIQT